MTTAAADALFVDTNILVYANVTTAPEHHHAVACLTEIDAVGLEAWLSRQILREYLAVLSQPGITHSPVPLSALPQDIEDFESSFSIAEDGPTVTKALSNLLRRIPAAGKQIHDANIVATMQVHGVRRLLTHNGADFARYAVDITVLPLTTPL